MLMIADNQVPGRYFADGAKFHSKEEVRQQLVSYHENDMEESDIETLKKMTLQEILDFGGWSIAAATK